MFGATGQWIILLIFACVVQLECKIYQDTTTRLNYTIVDIGASITSSDENSKYSTVLPEPKNAEAPLSIDECGGILYTESAKVTSPGYPRMVVFPYGTVCEWRIIGSRDYVYTIEFQDIDFPFTGQLCLFKIDVEETIIFSNTTRFLKTICGDKKNRDPVITSSNKVTIKLTFLQLFKTDQRFTNRGFRINLKSTLPVCGGLVTTPEGYLTTPGYPLETKYEICQWSIHVPNKSRRIHLELIDINHENHEIRLTDDFNHFFHMKNKTSSVHFVMKNQTFESLSSNLTIYVTKKKSAQSHRFKAKFTSHEPTLCGGDLSTQSHELVSPELQRVYTCKWRYNLQVTGRQNNLAYNSIFISTNFNSSVNKSECRYKDSKIILKSPINKRTFKRVICGGPEASYRIPSSLLHIIASKNSKDSFYYYLNWKTQPCGGTIHVSEKPVNIINTPDPYNDTLDCAWVLIVPDNVRAEITMEGSFLLGCDDEYLTITNGLAQRGTVIGSFCEGQVMKHPLVTHYTYLYIQYHSNVKTNTRIKLMANTVRSHCGGELTSKQGTFSSPNYPNAYPANVDCEWEIHAELGYRVSLQFIEQFVIESSFFCTEDVVVIYDWKNDDYKKMARICGHRAPTSYISTYNRLKVALRTNSDTNLDGFIAQWNTSCGGSFVATDEAQILYSPGYPYGQKSDMNCMYEIYTKTNQKILLTFLELDLEESLNCSSVSLTVITQRGYNDRQQVFCGNVTPPAMQSDEALMIIFKTGKELNEPTRGFRLSYSLQSCGDIINNATVITTPLKNNKYEINLKCTWLIEAPPNNIVVVKVFNMDLEAHSLCLNDYVAMYDGSDMHADKRLALLCGHIPSMVEVKSKANSMMVLFRTNHDTSYTGFKAAISFSYSEAVGCGGNIHLEANSSRVLKSPLVSKDVYDNYLNCHWSITSPPNTVIKMTFTKFSIAPCRNVSRISKEYSKCECDFVKIKDGLQIVSLVLGSYCGDALPPEFITSSNVMSVIMATDANLVSSGFEAIMTVEETLCKETIIPVSDTPYRFKSPGYDTESVPRGINCVYRLDKDKYSIVHVTIHNLELRPSVNDSSGISRCLHDRLVITGFWDDMNIKLGQDFIVYHISNSIFPSNFIYYETGFKMANHLEWCGHKETISFDLYSNISINIITSPDGDNEVHRGVEIEISYVGYCERNYSASQGRISAMTYTVTERDNDCDTLITAPENHTISAYFSEVIAEDNEDIYLEIFDGQDTNATLLTKIEYEDVRRYPVFSTGRYMLLHNHQVNWGRVKFDLNYVTTNKGIGCGGKFVNIVGAFTSPLYPNTYKRNSACEWVVETPAETRVLLRFVMFELGPNCTENYLQFIDNRGIVVGTYCSESPGDFKSDSNFVKVVFHTSENNSGIGWSLIFTSVMP